MGIWIIRFLLITILSNLLRQLLLLLISMVNINHQGFSEISSYTHILDKLCNFYDLIQNNCSQQRKWLNFS